MSGFYDEVDSHSGDYPESWKANPGDMVGGIVKRYDRGQAEFRGERREYWIAVLEVEAITGGADVQPGDEIGVWLMHKVLLDEFKARSPGAGQRVGIKMLEPKRADNGDTLYHRYHVRVEGNEAPDFNATDAADRAGHEYADSQSEPDREPPDEPRDPVEDTLQGTGPGAPSAEAPPPAGSGEDDLPF